MRREQGGRLGGADAGSGGKRVNERVRRRSDPGARLSGLYIEDKHGRVWVLPHLFLLLPAPKPLNIIPAPKAVGGADRKFFMSWSFFASELRRWQTLGIMTVRGVL